MLMTTFVALKAVAFCIHQMELWFRIESAFLDAYNGPCFSILIISTIFFEVELYENFRSSLRIFEIFYTRSVKK